MGIDTSYQNRLYDRSEQINNDPSVESSSVSKNGQENNKQGKDAFTSDVGTRVFDFEGIATDSDILNSRVRNLASSELLAAKDDHDKKAPHSKASHDKEIPHSKEAHSKTTHDKSCPSYVKSIWAEHCKGT